MCITIYDTDRFSAEVFNSFLFFFLSLMQASQFERKHYTEDTDDQQRISYHIDKSEYTQSRLPDDSDTTNDRQDTESHIPTPVSGAEPFQIHRITR